VSRATVLEELAAAALIRAAELRETADLDWLYQEALLFEKRDFAAALRRPGAGGVLASTGVVSVQ